MEKLNGNFKKWSAIVLTVLSFIWLAGCAKDNIVESQDNLSDKQAMEKIADNDESIASFEPNYNEDEAMSFALGKTTTQIYPVKVGQRMTSVNRNLDVTVNGDTAYGLLTKTFNGILFIAASYEPVDPANNPVVDTLIKKSFTTTITRKIIFVKAANTMRPLDNWKIAAISLPEGGTLTNNIEITKLTIFLANGDTLVVNSPNDYFLYKNGIKRHQLPNLSRGEATLIRVEVKSAYADTDFVTLTYGADIKGMHRSKRKLELISSSFDGQFYSKVYEQSYVTHQWNGHYHAIINAMPRQVVFDDATSVECKTWGIPYFVK
ncbi:MAG: hypothetical protein NTX22_08965 [Ignavibacteriales bacterium]|nr:hypothetical protein [Ignavibacteriales bacterium]